MIQIPFTHEAEHGRELSTRRTLLGDDLPRAANQS